MLYKYYGFDAGLAALEKHTLGFSDPRYFNDPMEARFWLHQNNPVLPNWLDQFLSAVGILCMTKHPLNPLMWSHYGENHRGFAIGYDASDPLFSEQLDTLIDADSGKTFTEPQFEFEDVERAGFCAMQWASMGKSEALTEEIREAIRHIFLMKQKCWEYEKEVRVVKLLRACNYSMEKWVEITGNNPEPISTPIAPMQSVGHPSKIYTLPASGDSIRHIVLGMRNPLCTGERDIELNETLANTIRGYSVCINQSEWTETGEMRMIDPKQEVSWGAPKGISVTKLDPEHLMAISDKISGQPVSSQSLTVTKFYNGHVSAYWDNEL